MLCVVQTLTHIAMYVYVCVPKNTVLIHYNRCAYVAMWVYSCSMRILNRVLMSSQQVADGVHMYR